MSRLADAGQRRVAAQQRPPVPIADLERRVARRRRQRRSRVLAAGVAVVVVAGALAFALVPSGKGERVSTGPATSSTPLPHPTTTAPPPSGSPIQGPLLDLSFLDSSHGFVLQQVCRSATCAEVVRATDDGGRTLGPIGFAVPGLNASTSSPDRLLFANRDDGIVWSPQLARPAEITHDGGRTWTALADSAPLDAARIGTDVWILQRDKPLLSSSDGLRTFTKLRSPGSGAALARLDATTAVVAGQGPVEATTDGGRTWSVRDDPCTPDQQFGALLAAGPGRSVWLVCTGSSVGTSSVGKSLHESVDLGWSWQKGFDCAAPGFPATGTCPNLDVGVPVSLAASSAGVFMGSDPWWIQGSFDGGATWRTVVSSESNGVPRVTFVDGEHGFATGDTGNQSKTGQPALWATSDGGRTWTRRYTTPG